MRQTVRIRGELVAVKTKRSEGCARKIKIEKELLQNGKNCFRAELFGFLKPILCHQNIDIARHSPICRSHGSKILGVCANS